MIWITLIVTICVFGFWVFANFRCYTAYTLNNTEAWKMWHDWKKQLEDNGFDVELDDVNHCGTYTNFYYKTKKKK